MSAVAGLARVAAGHGVETEALVELCLVTRFRECSALLVALATGARYVLDDPGRGLDALSWLAGAGCVT